MNAARTPLVDAVIVARNEEPYMRRCIESVLGAVAPFAGSQVVMVDSRSTDRTVDIAREYAITVVRLPVGVRCTAALGRAVGQRLTRGRHLLFVDGDTEIDANWVRAAVDTLQRHPEIAGVAGKLREVYYRHGVKVGENPDFFRMGEEVEYAYQLGGNALYRRQALEQVGGFNPGIISHEEAELADRLRAAGHRLVRIPLVVGTHHSGPRDSWGEPWRRLRSGLMIGYGQVLRLSLGTPAFWVHLRQLNRYLFTLGFLLAGVVALVVGVVTGTAGWVLAWLSVAMVATVLLILRGRGLRRPLAMLADWVLAAPGIMVGFVRRPATLSATSVEQLETVRTADAASRTSARGLGVAL